MQYKLILVMNRDEYTSRPTSPDYQLALLRERENQEVEISEEEIERYKKYKNETKK